MPPPLPVYEGLIREFCAGETFAARRTDGRRDYIDMQYICNGASGEEEEEKSTRRRKELFPKTVSQSVVQPSTRPAFMALRSLACSFVRCLVCSREKSRGSAIQRAIAFAVWLFRSIFPRKIGLIIHSPNSSSLTPLRL